MTRVSCVHADLPKQFLGFRDSPHPALDMNNCVTWGSEPPLQSLMQRYCWTLVWWPRFRQQPWIMLYKIVFLSLYCLKRAWDNQVRCNCHRNATVCLSMIRSDPWLLEKQAFGAFPYCTAYWSMATLDITSRATSVEDVCCTVKERNWALSSSQVSAGDFGASTAAYMRLCFS